MASKIVAVLGATGVYGRHLVPRLILAGYQVRALVRDPTRATGYAAAGADVRTADIFDIASLRMGLNGCEYAVNLATALPAPAKPGGDFNLNDRLRREGVPLFLQACADAGVRRIVQQSIAMVHCGGGDVWADEETRHIVHQETAAGKAIAAARDMEEAVRRSAVDWLILRGALFYGPGTGMDDDWFSRARSGTLRLPEDGRDFVSLIHIADMAAATVSALAAWPSRQALIIADDGPCRWRDLYAYVATYVGGPEPLPGGPHRLPSFRVSNRRARELLNWTPRYASYASGLVR